MQGGVNKVGAVFAQQGIDAKSCFAWHNCGEKGHFAREGLSKGSAKKDDEQIHTNVCDEEDLDQRENIFVQEAMARKAGGMIDRNHVLLNN